MEISRNSISLFQTHVWIQTIYLGKKVFDKSLLIHIHLQTHQISDRYLNYDLLNERKRLSIQKFRGNSI